VALTELELEEVPIKEVAVANQIGIHFHHGLMII
jgi:hypothetical protein